MFDLLEVILDASGESHRPRLELIATIIATFAYGFIACLFLHTLSLLITNQQHIYTRTMRSILITYTIVMFTLSTASAIQQITSEISFIMTIVYSDTLKLKMNELFFLPLTIFGADGFMLWRSVILYQDASPRCRGFLYSLLVLISIGSLGSAILYYVGPQISAFALKSPFTPSIIAISITTSLNFMLTAIIAGRLLYHQETMRRILGKEYRSPYMRVIIMLVESCNLIVVTGLVFLIFVAVGNLKRYNGCVIPYFLLPHVCVLSPLLITYHVARGRAVTSTTVRLSQVVTPSGGIAEDPSYLEPMWFNCPAATFDQGGSTLDLEVVQFECLKLGNADGNHPPKTDKETFPISLV